VKTSSGSTNELAVLTAPVFWSIAKISVEFPMKEYRISAFAPSSWSVHSTATTVVPFVRRSLSLSFGLGLRNPQMPPYRSVSVQSGSQTNLCHQSIVFILCLLRNSLGYAPLPHVLR